MRYLSRLISYLRPEHLRHEHAIFEFLKRSGTAEIPHSGKSLFEHLRGTYLLLRQWECGDAVCYAGLFHSVYGTHIFRHQAIPYTKREEVRRLIGKEAEWLAYLFSVSDRPPGLIRALRTCMIFDTVNQTDVVISTEELRALIIIECANLLDQRAVGTFIKEAVEEARKANFLLGNQLLACFQPLETRKASKSGSSAATERMKRVLWLRSATSRVSSFW